MRNGVKRVSIIKHINISPLSYKMYFWKPLIIIPALTFVSFSFAYIYYNWINGDLKKKLSISDKPRIDPEAKYISERKSAFMRTYTQKYPPVTQEKYNSFPMKGSGIADSDDRGVPPTDFNSSIEPEFYDKEKYTAIMKEEVNVLETAWKKRILFDSTPRGNIVLFYDPYKHGFSYYSDQHIPYSLLNAAAMKYCRIFRCRDFFMDEQVTPEYSPSALLSQRIQEEKKELVEKKAKISAKIGSSTTAFAKFKNYSNPIPITKPSIQLTNLPKIAIPNAPVVSPKEYMKNKFIHLGKMANWNILLKKPKPKNISVNKSDIMGYLDSNTDVQKQVFNYRDYKKSLLT